MLNDLTIRFASSVALGVPFLLSVYAGTPYFDFWIVAAIVVLAWEWYRLTQSAGGMFGFRGMMFVLCALVAVLAAALVSPLIGVIVAGAAAMGMLVPGRGNGWLAGGIVYLVFPCSALLWLRHDAADGQTMTFWLIAIV